MNNISIKPFIPKTRCSKTILSSFAVYFAAVILRDFLYSFDLFNLSSTERIVEYTLRVVRDAGLSIGLMTMIIGGLQTIRGESFSVNKIVMPTFGVLACVCLAGYSWYAHTLMQDDVVKLIEHDQIFAKKLEDKLPELFKNPQEKSEVIKIGVRMLFVTEGKRIAYPNKDGQTVVYEPTEEDKTRFAQMKETKYMLQQLNISLERAAYLWISILVLSTIIGMVWPPKMFIISRV